VCVCVCVCVCVVVVVVKSWKISMALAELICDFPPGALLVGPFYVFLSCTCNSHHITSFLEFGD
jgi:hypothetical protein